MSPGAITLFGELHGTREVPQFVGDLACIAAKSHPVRVGLEIPAGMNSVLKTYLGSDGSPAAMKTLLSHSFWSFEDGRSSHAMLNLIDRMRVLRQSGREVEVFGFDGVFFTGGMRDMGMAENIKTMLRSPTARKTVSLLLSGNLHARTDSERWMGHHIRAEFPRLITLDNAFSGGNAWLCLESGCGSMTVGGRDRGERRFVEQHIEPTAGDFSGIYYLGRASASAPAKNVNSELASIFSDDQSDRQGAPAEFDGAVVGPRDEKRRAQVAKILNAGGAKSSTDFFHAAMVFQHGDSVEHFQRAHELAMKAVKLDSSNESAKWLAAAAKDRSLMYEDKPQVYGTQFTYVKGKWVLYEVDPSTTDAERSTWNVPPLAKARARANEMNEPAK